MWETVISILGTKSLDFFGDKLSRSRDDQGLVADLIDELKANMLRCELVIKHNATPQEEGISLSRDAYRALRNQNYNFGKIKKGTIPPYQGMKDTDIAFLEGKSLAQALQNISDRVQEISTISKSSASLDHIDLKRRFTNLAKRLAVVMRFISSK